MSHCLTSQIALTMPNAETIFFIPYFESPRSSCPSTHLLTGSFLRAEAGSLVLAHSSLHFTKYPFSAMREEKLWSNFPTEECASLHMPHREQRTGGKCVCIEGAHSCPKARPWAPYTSSKSKSASSPQLRRYSLLFVPVLLALKLKTDFFFRWK